MTFLSSFVKFAIKLDVLQSTDQRHHCSPLKMKSWNCGEVKLQKANKDYISVQMTCVSKTRYDMSCALYYVSKNLVFKVLRSHYHVLPRNWTM